MVPRKGYIHPSDARTSSPLASVRTAYGRCGEESTFTVAALRAVGIPARQVYTPRWAHTDDNHAWVEAWVDGEWHFLGACEPEPVLDLAWFNAPASRGMLMHTNAFGNYDGPEEVVGRTPCTTEINVTANYAPVAPVTVRVLDKRAALLSQALSIRYITMPSSSPRRCAKAMPMAMPPSPRARARCLRGLPKMVCMAMRCATRAVATPPLLCSTKRVVTLPLLK